jgi:hypothetical protein
VSNAPYEFPVSSSRNALQRQIAWLEHGLQLSTCHSR